MHETEKCRNPDYVQRSISKMPSQASEISRFFSFSQAPLLKNCCFLADRARATQPLQLTNHPTIVYQKCHMSLYSIFNSILLQSVTCT